YGRYSEEFPIKRTTLGYGLIPGIEFQRIVIKLTSKRIEIYDKEMINKLKDIPYTEINVCNDINVVKHFNINGYTIKGKWNKFWYDFNVIYLNYSHNKAIYLLFWSTLGKWQKKLHYKIFNIIKEHKELPNLKDFIIDIARTYENYKVPMLRIKKNFPLETTEILEILEKSPDEDFEFQLSNDFVKVEPKPKIEILSYKINGEKRTEIVDEYEINLQFDIKNNGKFPVNVYLHIDSANLPDKKPLPPFKIEPGKTVSKPIQISTRVKDNEYGLDILLCDNDKNNLEIKNSGIKLIINKKTSKKQKLKNILKEVICRSVDTVGKMGFKI
ncbi:MAG: hypothetical protein ACTSO9_20515, partial [Candidatus Helarchaeota archaeon]